MVFATSSDSKYTRLRATASWNRKFFLPRGGSHLEEWRVMAGTSWTRSVSSVALLINYGKDPSACGFFSLLHFGRKERESRARSKDKKEGNARVSAQCSCRPPIDRNNTDLCNAFRTRSSVIGRQCKVDERVKWPRVTTVRPTFCSQATAKALPGGKKRAIKPEKRMAIRDLI